MNISIMRNYWFKSRRNDSLFAAISIMNNSVILVILKLKNESREINNTFTEYFQNEASRLSAIEKILSKVPASCRLSIILPEGTYQWLLLDKPALAEKDINASLPWLLKDLVSFNGEDIVADYYDFPLEQFSQDKLHVAVTRRQFLLPIINLVHKKKLDLYSISTYEMACCELVVHDGHAHMIVTQQPNSTPNLHIIRNGQLLFTRKFDGLEGLAHLPLIELKKELVDIFLRELQHSLDYYQSHLKQSPPTSLQLSIPNPEIDGLVEEISYFFALKVSVFSPSLAICEQQNSDVQFAIAAALSSENREQNEVAY